VHPIWLRPWAWLVVSALCVYVTNSWMPASGKVGPLWETILLAPGLSQHVIVPYAVIPWLAVGAAGMYFGYWWRAYPGSHNRVWIVGGLLAIFGIVLRAFGGWGNIVQPRDMSWIEFLNNVKYPPSLVFWTMSVGIDLLLLAALMRLPEAFRAARSPLVGGHGQHVPYPAARAVRLHPVLRHDLPAQLPPLGRPS